MIKTLFGLALTALIFYSAYLVAVPYLNWYAFKSDAKEILKVSVIEDEEEIRAKVMDIAQQHHIPIKAADIQLTHDGYFTAVVSWKVTVDFFTVYQKTFKFYVNTGEGA